MVGTCARASSPSARHLSISACISERSKRYHRQLQIRVAVILAARRHSVWTLASGHCGGLRTGHWSLSRECDEAWAVCRVGVSCHVCGGKLAQHITMRGILVMILVPLLPVSCIMLNSLTPSPSLPWSCSWSHIAIFWDQEWCLVLRAVPTAPVAPVHRSKASGGRDWVSPRGPKASLGSFRRSARTLALAVRVV